MRKNITFIVFTISYLLLAISYSGCGYTTRGFLDPQHRTIYVKPVVNSVKVTGETQEFTDFRSVPPFLEQSFTQALISRFGLDGNLKLVKEDAADLVLECTITDFVRSTLRYDDQDRVEEYRLKIYFNYKLFDRGGNVVGKNSLVADSEYALVGRLAKSENQAISELLEEAARKAVEDVIEAW